MNRLPMIAYLYDEETGIYLNHTVEAKEDPKQKGHFNIPVNATLEAPPSVPDPWRHVAVYRNDEWVIERKASVPLTDETAAPVKTKKVKAPDDAESRR